MKASRTTLKKLDQKIVRLLKTRYKGMAILSHILAEDIAEDESLTFSRLRSLARRGIIKRKKAYRKYDAPVYFYYPTRKHPIQKKRKKHTTSESIRNTLRQLIRQGYLKRTKDDYYFLTEKGKRLVK